jgi:phosphatidylserine/phosphatidylglycerophosphate/cardiolipin synthase-like enzyme
VLAEPAAGIGRIYRLITGARHSVELTMYELRDATAERDLAADASRGVDVRVILDQHLEKARNEAAYSYLTGHGVHVAWAPQSMTYHQKTLTIDGATSVIMTLNMVTSDYAGTRDFAVIDMHPADIAAIVATFSADFAGKGEGYIPPNGSGLAWSPTNSQGLILSVINGATHTLTVENEEMGSGAVTSALVAAARRGVNVTITMTAQGSWDSAFRELVAAGAHVHTYPDTSGALYIHAKAVVADAGRAGQRVFVGSENFSTASLRRNRELGIDTTQAAVISAISAALARDYAGAAPFSSLPAAGLTCGRAGAARQGGGAACRVRAAMIRHAPAGLEPEPGGLSHRLPWPRWLLRPAPPGPSRPGFPAWPPRLPRPSRLCRPGAARRCR